MFVNKYQNWELHESAWRRKESAAKSQKSKNHIWKPRHYKNGSRSFEKSFRGAKRGTYEKCPATSSTRKHARITHGKEISLQLKKQLLNKKKINSFDLTALKKNFQTENNFCLQSDLQQFDEFFKIWK